MQILNSFRFKLVLILPVILYSASPVMAHEPRDNVAGGAYNISVGHRVEPGFAGEPNAFDLFVRNALDDSNADVTDIDLEVYVMRLKTDEFDAIL